MSTPDPTPPPAAPPAALPPTIAALFAAVAPAPSVSKAVIVGGVGASSLGIYIAERLLANDGQIAASMLTRLSPLLGPVWASWPVIGILLGAVIWAASKWGADQRARSVSNIAAALASAEISHKVGAVAAGLDGLRSEVHDLRGALQDHAEQVDVRFRDHDAGLRAVQADVSAVRADVSQVSRRVDGIENPRRHAAPPKPRAR